MRAVRTRNVTATLHPLRTYLFQTEVSPRRLRPRPTQRSTRSPNNPLDSSIEVVESDEDPGAAASGQVSYFLSLGGLCAGISGIRTKPRRS